MVINMTEISKFHLVLKGEGINIDKKDISEDLAAKIVRLVMPLSAIGGAGAGAEEERHKPSEELGGTSLTPKQFMAQKLPKSDIERITCLAYYLTHYKNTPQFKTVDLTHLNTDAAQPRLSNASFAARNAVNNQYLAPAGGGRKQIAPRGEAVVKALPDRTAVAAALKSYPAHSRHKTPKKRKAKS